MVGAVLKAVMAHLYIAWIHPFGDGNGRTARLVEFYLLVNAGVPEPSAHLLSNHYNLTRSEYYRQLDAASQTKSEVVPFVHYAVRGFADGLRDQLLVIRQHQLSLAWRDFVDEKLAGDSPEKAERCRLLLVGLSKSPRELSRDQLPLLDPRLAQRYARKSERTLVRDLSDLEARGLVARGPEGYRAR